MCFCCLAECMHVIFLTVRERHIHRSLVIHFNRIAWTCLDPSDQATCSELDLSAICVCCEAVMATMGVVCSASPTLLFRPCVDCGLRSRMNNIYVYIHVYVYIWQVHIYVYIYNYIYIYHLCMSRP